MRTTVHFTLICFAIILLIADNLAAQAQTQVNDRFANTNGVRLHYLIAGKGDSVILLHGYAQNSHMWRPLMIEVAKSHTVMRDLRGFGQSSKPMTGYEKNMMAQDIHALAVAQLVDLSTSRRRWQVWRAPQLIIQLISRNNPRKRLNRRCGK